MTGIFAHTMIGNILVYGFCLIGLGVALFFLFAPQIEEIERKERDP